MTRLRKIDNYPSRQKGLAFTLALALGLGLGLGLTGAAAAAPADQGASPQWLSGLDLQQVPEEVLAPFADGLAEQAQTQASQALAGTIQVLNCANSGGGSLRDAVATASSGDTIDLSQLSCTNINLTSGEIPIPDASLTIKGKPGTGLQGPKPQINGLVSSRIFNHTGTGTLTLRNVYVINGAIDASVVGNSQVLGGCVYSAGTVKLYSAYVVGCSAESLGSSGWAAGGGIYADSNIFLYDDSWIIGNKVEANRNAYGGGLYSDSNMYFYGSAGMVINTNSATVEPDGWARGGGIYAKTGMLGGNFTLQHNTVEGTSATAVTGGGIYTGVMALGQLTVGDNHAVGAGSQGGGLYVAGVANISGTITENDAEGDGGGLYAKGSATVRTSTISDNTVGSSGGGIYAEDGLTLEASTVADNTASYLGGGVAAPKGLTVEDSNVIGNHADSSGGGLYTIGDVTIKGSTIANNTSTLVAGATMGADATRPIAIDQSTISGNVSSDWVYGAGLYLKNDTVIKNRTITKNVETNTSNTLHGAGISLADGVQLTLSSTIVSRNLRRNSQGGDSTDDIGKGGGASTGYDILGSHNGIWYSTVTTPSDTIFAPPSLNALADNGGPTLTHLPKPDSLAIDNGTANGFSCDQRGAGFARLVGFAADIGAVEVQDDENTDRIFANGFEPASTSCSQ